MAKYIKLEHAPHSKMKAQTFLWFISLKRNDRWISKVKNCAFPLPLQIVLRLSNDGGPLNNNDEFWRHLLSSSHFTDFKSAAKKTS